MLLAFLVIDSNAFLSHINYQRICDFDLSSNRLADTALRTSTRMQSLAVAILSGVAERPNGAAVVIEQLAQDPPWRGVFFGSLSSTITNARTPLVLLQSLRETATPPRDTEVLPYLRFLLAKGFPELAYYTWLQFLPSDKLARAGFLFNGAFESQPSGSPFDWTVTGDTGTTIDFSRFTQSQKVPRENDPQPQLRPQAEIEKSPTQYERKQEQEGRSNWSGGVFAGRVSHSR